MYIQAKTNIGQILYETMPIMTVRKQRKQNTAQVCRHSPGLWTFNLHSTLVKPFTLKNSNYTQWFVLTNRQYFSKTLRVYTGSSVSVMCFMQRKVNYEKCMTNWC